MSNSVNWPWAALNSDNAGSASSVFKAVSAKNSAKPAMTALAQTSPASTPQDTVNVSKLGKALTGMAAKAYDRTQLNNLVESGKVSAEDAVKGLRELAKFALFNRFAHEAPTTKEEEDAGRKGRELMAPIAAHMKGDDGSKTTFRADSAQLKARHEKGEISDEDYMKEIMEARQRAADVPKELDGLAGRGKRLCTAGRS